MENLGLWPDVIAFTAIDQPEELRSFAFWTLATASHHNPKVQEAILRHGMLAKSFDSLHSDPSGKVKLKCVSLVSALVKSNVTGFLEFTKLSGIQKLSNIYSTTGISYQ